MSENKQTRKYTVSKTKLKGEWVNYEDNIYICKNCKLVWLMANEGTPESNEMNFCPRCGANMGLGE